MKFVVGLFSPRYYLTLTPLHGPYIAVPSARALLSGPLLSKTSCPQRKGVGWGWGWRWNEQMSWGVKMQSEARGMLHSHFGIPAHSYEYSLRIM
jgi:hypothetical protein